MIAQGLPSIDAVTQAQGAKANHDQIKALRRTLASDYGFVMPAVRILDNMRLPSQGYAIRIKEMEAGAGEVRLGQVTRDDDELAVARAVLQGGEFHGMRVMGAAPGGVEACIVPPCTRTPCQPPPPHHALPMSMNGDT